MDSIAIAVNDLGEPDAGDPPVRFDEGRETMVLTTSSSPAYSTKPDQFSRPRSDANLRE